MCEMGGKNPAIVSAKADLDRAAEGVLRSAFGFSGQKCSACSRVYVERAVAGEFTGRLADRAAQLRVGDPLDREVYLGPVIHDEAVDRFKGAVKEARKEGRVLAGGEVLRAGCPRATTSPRRSSPSCRPITGCSGTSCSCRSWPWPRSTPWTRRWSWPTTPSTA